MAELHGLYMGSTNITWELFFLVAICCLLVWTFMKNEVNQLGILSLINKRTGDWPILALHMTWNQEIDRSLSHLSVSHYHHHPPPSPPHHG